MTPFTRPERDSRGCLFVFFFGKSCDNLACFQRNTSPYRHIGNLHRHKSGSKWLDREPEKTSCRYTMQTRCSLLRCWVDSTRLWRKLCLSDNGLECIQECLRCWKGWEVRCWHTVLEEICEGRRSNTFRVVITLRVRFVADSSHRIVNESRLAVTSENFNYSLSRTQRLFDSYTQSPSLSPGYKSSFSRHNLSSSIGGRFYEIHFINISDSLVQIADNPWISPQTVISNFQIMITSLTCIGRRFWLVSSDGYTMRVVFCFELTGYFSGLAPLVEPNRLSADKRTILKTIILRASRENVVLMWVISRDWRYYAKNFDSIWKREISETKQNIAHIAQAAHFSRRLSCLLKSTDVLLLEPLSEQGKWKRNFITSFLSKHHRHTSQFGLPTRKCSFQ